MRLLGVDITSEWDEIETRLGSSEDSCLSRYCLDEWDVSDTYRTCDAIEWCFFFSDGDRVWYISLPVLPDWDSDIDRSTRECLDDDRLLECESISTRTEGGDYGGTGDFFGGVIYCGYRLERISRIGDIGYMSLDSIVLAYLDRLLCYGET